jgi:CubicO group peptidase (beta-lactamase class C family)
MRARGRTGLSLAGLGVVLLLGATAEAKDRKSKVPAIDAALAKEFDEAISNATAGKPFWGTILAARKGQVVFVRGYGFADYERKPNTPESLFEIASASKQVTATAILRLEQQKKLKTTDSLGRFWKDVPKDKRKVTVQHLLNHTSGLDPTLGVPYAWPGSRDAYVKQMLEKPLVEEPGKKYSYSNVGYALLAAVVEETTGGTFEDYVRQELFARAGLEDTGFIGDERLVKSEHVTARRCSECRPEWSAARWMYGWGYRGMGGVVTTALDLHLWDRALRGKEILGEPAKAKLYQPALETYACGWKVERDGHGLKAHHSGGVMGYVCQVTRWLDTDALVVILTSGEPNLRGIETAVANVLFR